MQEYSRIIIEEYCRTHTRTKKAQLLGKLVEMSYDLSAMANDQDMIKLEELIERENDPELREAMEELDEFFCM